MILIHKAKEEEIPAIKELLYFTWVDTYSGIYSRRTLDKLTSVWHSHDALQSQIANQNNFFVVAKDIKSIVGVLTAHRENTVLVISKLYIHPSHQRKGLGKMLFESALQAFENISKIRLEVEKENPKGMSFYRKQGFVELATKKDNVEGEIVECIVMEKII